MKGMKTVVLGCLLWSAWGIPGLTQPSETQSAPASEGTAADLAIEPAAPIFKPQVGVRFHNGTSGYDSFVNLEGFIPLLQNPGNSLTFLDAKLRLSTDNTALGGNILLGHRFFSGENNRVFGVYAAWDNRNTGRTSFNQIGLGFDTLGETWDARINAYLPIGQTRRLVDKDVFESGFSYSQPFFQGYNLASIQSQQIRIDRTYETAATGLDAEVGTRIARLGTVGDLRGFGGVYYYSIPKGDSFVGWRARLEARPRDTMVIGLGLQSDREFGTNLLFNIGISFPGSGASRATTPQQQLLARMGESVNRQTSIWVKEQQTSETRDFSEAVALTNPATGQPYIFRHVNLGIGIGDGTFENPFGIVNDATAIAQSGDIIYVQPGTNPGIPNFTLPNGVQFLSTGPVQTLDTTEFGNLQLPLSGAGVLPTVVETGTLGSDNVVNGFAFNSTPGAGLTGTGITNTTILNNTFTNTGAHGILLNDANGTVTITNNQFTNTGNDGVRLNRGSATIAIRDNRLTNPGNDGVDLNSTAGVATIANNTIDSPRFSGILNFNTSGPITITNNTINNAGLIGVDLFETTGATTITSNVITGATFSGVFLEETAGDVAIANNTITNSPRRGIGGFNHNGSLTIADNRVSGTVGVGIVIQNNIGNPMIGISNNTLTNNLGGIIVLVENAATVGAQIQANTLDNSDGILLSSSETSVFTATVSGNTVKNASTVISGIGYFATDNSTGNVTITNNTLDNIDGTGISVSVGGFGSLLDVVPATKVSATISGNQISNIVDSLYGSLEINHAIQVLVDYGGDLQSLTIADNTVTNNWDYGGISILDYSGSTATVGPVTINNNTIDDVQLQGISIIDVPSDNISITNNTINNVQGIESADAGIIIDNDFAKTTVNIANNTINGNSTQTVNGIELDISESASVTATIENNIINNSGADGLKITTLRDSQATVDVSNNRINNAIDTGIDIAAGNSSTINLTLQGNEVTLSTSQSAYLSAFDSATLNADVQNNNFTSGTPGFQADANNDSLLCLNLNANNSTNGYQLNNLSSGVIYEVINFGTISTNNTGTVTPSGTINDVSDCGSPAR